MFIFESPLNLLLLLGIPSGIYLRHISPRRGGRIPFPIKIWKGSAPRVPVRLRALLLFSHTCFWLGIAGLVLVLSGPGIAHKQRIYLNRGIDIMLVVDVSPSMAIQDFGQQSRLEVTRKLLKDFVMTRENDAIGIVSFGRDAALRVSPTIDHGAVLGAIDQLAIFDHGDASAMG
ncbi:MAG: VWA domain-containing protein, partial [Spirochaetaceae bacterium]